jgi:hypothetical protein
MRHKYMFKKNKQITIIVWRNLRDQSNGLARPCNNCCKYLRKFCVRSKLKINVIYSTELGYKKEKAINISNDFITSGNIC